MWQLKTNSWLIDQRIELIPIPLIPAKAGIQIETKNIFSNWLPASAGTSGQKLGPRLRGDERTI